MVYLTGNVAYRQKGSSKFVAARVIHFRTDDCQRLHFLRKAGYEVEVCGNILQLRTALRSEADTDAVVMNDSDGSLHENAISVVRSETAFPLVLFASSYRTYNPADFDLVVSPSASPGEWAIDFALMIVRSRVLREYSQVLRSSSARLRHESERVRIHSDKERERSRRECARNAGLTADHGWNRLPNDETDEGPSS